MEPSLLQYIKTTRPGLVVLIYYFVREGCTLYNCAQLDHTITYIQIATLPLLAP